MEEAEAMYRVSALSTPLFLENASSYGGLTLVNSAKQMSIEHVTYHASNDSGSTIENYPEIFQLKELVSSSNEMLHIVRSTESIKNSELDESKSIASDDGDISSQNQQSEIITKSYSRKTARSFDGSQPGIGYSIQRPWHQRQRVGLLLIFAAC